MDELVQTRESSSRSTPVLRRSRRLVVLIAAGSVIVAVLWLIGRPATHLIGVTLRDKSEEEMIPPGFVDDASRLNRTAVAQVIDVPADRTLAERQLAELLHRAAAEELQVSIAGARHTMGGHTIAPGGIVLNMQTFNQFELDSSGRVLHTQSGARWDQIIPYLDQRGRSIEIMQSNNSFTVGGSISANCHGWQPNRPPIASTVLAMRVMTVDGAVVTCSREENAELFSLVLGGYGLFGIILDVDLRVVPNARYRLERFVVDSSEFAQTFRKEVAGRDDAQMAYGRLCVASDGFLRQAVLNVFRPAPDSNAPMPALTEASLVGMKRSVFRGSVGNDYGKQLRWDLERLLSDHLAQEFVSRNQLLNDSVELYRDRSAATTDILQEYFIPPEALEDFLTRARAIIPDHAGDLLNVTIRHVLADQDSLLRYADREMLALVLLFSQQRTVKGDARMQTMTQELIDAALAVGGRHYLPYRLHASVDQFHRAYPQARRFFELKRKYDPHELLQNQFYQKYGGWRQQP